MNHKPLYYFDEEDDLILVMPDHLLSDFARDYKSHDPMSSQLTSYLRKQGLLLQGYGLSSDEYKRIRGTLEARGYRVW
jgi:hypothetical protein